MVPSAVDPAETWGAAVIAVPVSATMSLDGPPVSTSVGAIDIEKGALLAWTPLAEAVAITLKVVSEPTFGVVPDSAEPAPCKTAARSDGEEENVQVGDGRLLESVPAIALPDRVDVGEVTVTLAVAVFTAMV